MNTICFYILLTLTIGCTSHKAIDESNEQQDNCLTIENFNSIASYIEDHGEQVKNSERLLSDKESFSLEVSFGTYLVLLEDCQDFRRIIIIDNNEGAKIPPYFVSNRNNEIHISAYYSRLDTEEDMKKRAENWCNIVLEFEKIQ
ncbi:MAG: hypothetical protein JXR53_13400 [Bacteroidales bacterium]|nr:hypothetical protein [Bacteroidales bacterium]